MQKEDREYCVNVVYSMVHTMCVEASSKKEAEEKAIEQFPEETDLMDDEIDEILMARAVEI